MTRTLASALASALLGFVLPAQGLDPRLLPSDTTFVAHLDLRALVGLVGEERLRVALRDEGADMAAGFLITAWELWTGEGAGREREPQQPDELERLEREWGVNLFRDLHSFTLFGSDTADGGAGLLVVASAAVNDALTRLRREGALRSEPTAGLATERLSLDALGAALGQPAAAPGEDKVAWMFVNPLDGKRLAIVIGMAAEQVLPAARTLRGEAPSLAAAPRGTLELRPEAANIVYAELLDVPPSLRELARGRPESELGDLADHLVVDLSGKDGQVALHLLVDTGSKREARRAAVIAHGLRLLLSHAVGDEVPDVVSQTLRRAKVRAKGKRLTLELETRLAGLDAVGQGGVRRR